VFDSRVLRRIFGANRDEVTSEWRKRHTELVVEETTLGRVSSEYFSVLCHSFHQLLHTLHHPSSGADTTGQIVADVPSGFSYTVPQETKALNEIHGRLFTAQAAILLVFTAAGLVQLCC
jgi:hypothetical protein